MTGNHLDLLGGAPSTLHGKQERWDWKTWQWNYHKENKQVSGIRSVVYCR